MMQEQDIQDKIDLYLRDQLSSEDRVLFEEQLSKDDALREEFELTRSIVVGVQLKAENQIIADISTLEEQTFIKIINESRDNRKPSKLSRRWVYSTVLGVAASIILFIFGVQPQYTSVELYAEYYAVPIHQITPPSRGATPINAEQIKVCEQAIIAYKNSEFTDAASLFSVVAEVIKPELLPDDYFYYWTICLLEIGDSEEAINNFTTISNWDYSEFQEDADWQLALIYMKLDERDRAESMLQTIVNNSGAYSDVAKELINKNSSRRWF